MINPSPAKFVERTRKPKKCPSCGFAPVAKILYGYPAFSEELDRELDKGTITLGGCCIIEGQPVWQCSKCQLLIYRKAR